MPFVQRVVQPTQLAQVSANSIASTSVKSTRFHCIPGKCQNNNCINKQQQLSEELSRYESAGEENNGEVSRAAASVKDIVHTHEQQTPAMSESITTAIIHTQQLNGDANVYRGTTNTTNLPDHAHNQTNGFAGNCTYVSDTVEEAVVLSTTPSLVLEPAILPMKKLKHHVEFLSNAPSARSPNRSSDVLAARATHRHPVRTSQSATAIKIVSGYEFDSISNITLSNALRQLASLVLIASDIFDELQLELQNVGDRTRAVQRKILTVERRVCAYDPKMVTVPESDLLTFAQRKTHFESEKSFRKELFTTETRPRSVRLLYDDAVKAASPPSGAASPLSPSFTSNGGVNSDDMDNMPDTGATMHGGCEELVWTPVFGEAKRKMRTRIDAEIEIRLPAAIEDLRKWTSSEALGDVTVTPDCMHHVDMCISTSVLIGDNGVLTPALSPSVLSADAVDTLYSINVSNAVDNSQIPNDINKDVPLNHRLPSPEEQCKIIALRYPAVVISVDTSGKRFERMCLARKSTTGCLTSIADANNLNDDIQTVSRRSRSRKVRGKRRNTIAGIDQKEIEDAANGDSTATGSGEIKNALAVTKNASTDAEADYNDNDNNNDLDGRRTESKSKKFGRSKSSDILKKEYVALPYDKGKNTLTRLNSLKQWGRNRFKFMQRCEATVGASGNGSHNTSNSSQNISTEKTESSNGNNALTKPPTYEGDNKEIRDECIANDRISQKSDSRFSHERKPSYSSSEKSVSVSSSGHLRGKLHLATCGSVKLRDTSSLNRQRRNGISANRLGGKDEQPHSSSGNWSASSESGRASIGSEITIQPKSSASNTSLNVSSFHPGSGPPSSMLSRRRFLNTSASSSVTSEGTATPDLQVAESGYPNQLDDETSSAYSCDTEGYYTSFHMDSGLRTLKEEEPMISIPLQNNQNIHMNNYSFGSQFNQTILSAENEYELFGRGSTSTTTSSAGTVCTTLMVNGEQSSLSSHGPDVPERISSLCKLTKSNQSNSASTSTLERSYSSSTIGSTLERTGTIKRNVNAPLKFTTQSKNSDQREDNSETPESVDEEFEFSERVDPRSAQPLLNANMVAEMEYSESSDLEGVERIERIKQKTAINAKRIPSMCIITPTTSDDENQTKDGAFDPNKTLTNESSPCSEATAKAEATLKFIVNEATGYCTIDTSDKYESLRNAQPLPIKFDNIDDTGKDHNLNVLKRNSNYGFNNMLEKLKVVLPSIKRATSKSSQPSPPIDDDELYDTAGEYVTITDISNNNRHNQMHAPKALGASSLGIYYSNDIVRRRPNDASDSSKGRELPLKRQPEYVSLNELPHHLRTVNSACRGISSAGTNATFGINNQTVPTSINKENEQRRADKCAESMQQSENTTVPMYAEISELREKPLLSPSSQNKGARIRVNSQGKIIYDSDSLKRRKGAHTTFAPGPYVKETESALPGIKSAAFVVNAITTVKQLNGESASSSTKVGNLVPQATAAKLLLLNGSIATPRIRTNVRPIVPPQPLNQPTNNTAPNTSMASSVYLDQSRPLYSYPDNNSFLVSPINSFIQPTLTAAGIPMMPSPSTKSTSSTGSTNSSTTSTNTSGSSSSNEEGYLRFYKTIDQLQPPQPPQSQSYQPNLEDCKDVPSFQRNTPVYWTLQNRRHPKPQSRCETSRDDLYATPIRRSQRSAATASRAAAISISSNNISPIVPRNEPEFLTSTPTKLDPASQPAVRNANWELNSPERFNTCFDRIGHSKTSLLDFKKLLLAKSTKTSPVQKKVSAVELLKKTNGSENSATPTADGGNGTTAPAPMNTLNSSLKLLDLSGSPKTFANRRMLRQGQFGSPSKSFAPKLKSSPCGWRNGVQRTDIISTTIPEANSEEDHSNTSASNSSRANCEMGDTAEQLVKIDTIESAAQRFDRKRNFFLQTEENNFMRGELKHTFGKNTTAATQIGLTATTAKSSPLMGTRISATTVQLGVGNEEGTTTANLTIAMQPTALETAL